MGLIKGVAGADGMVKTVSGVESLGSRIVQTQRSDRRKAQRIAELEAQIAELTAERQAASA